MEIIEANVLGFCMGVKNAINKAQKALEEYKDKKVYTLGPLIHNSVVLENLTKNGLIILKENEIDSVENKSVVVIRAHGVSPKVENQLKEKDCIIINATCPRVTLSQKQAQKYSELGYIVVLAGDKDHGEVEGIAGFAGDNFRLIRNVEDAKAFKIDEVKSKSQKVVLLSQSTFSPKEFEEITSILKDKINDIEVLNTICPATKERQDALEELCPKVEGLLVIGGRNSANTQRLFKKAQSRVKIAALVERSQEIPEDFFKLNKIGITAGASTPDEVIKECENTLNNRNANLCKE